jgi:hypothetical protein
VTIWFTQWQPGRGKKRGCYLRFFSVRLCNKNMAARRCAVQGSSSACVEVSSFDCRTVPTAFKGLDFERTMDVCFFFI